MHKKCDGEGRVWTRDSMKPATAMSCHGCDLCCPTWIEKVSRLIQKEREEGTPIEGAAPMGSDGYEWLMAARCIKLVRDMEKNGVRFDLMPTTAFGPGQLYESEAAWWHDYVKRIDDSMKEKAAKAMSGEVETGVGYVAGTKPVTEICVGCAKPVGAVADQCASCEKWGCCMDCLKLHQKECHKKPVRKKKAGKCVCDEPGVGLQKCSLCDWWVCLNCGQAHNESVHATFKL